MSRELSSTTTSAQLFFASINGSLEKETERKLTYDWQAASPPSFLGRAMRCVLFCSSTRRAIGAVDVGDDHAQYISDKPRDGGF